MVCQGPILTNDLATITGFAFGTPGERIVYGSFELGHKGWSVGNRLYAFRQWFMDFTSINHPHYFVFEAPLPPRVLVAIGTRPETVLLMFGLAAIAECCAIERRIPVVKQVSVQDVRQHFLEQRTFKGGRKVSKPAVMEECRRLRWNPKDDNAADALAIWSMGESIWSPATSSQRRMNAMAAGLPGLTEAELKAAQTRARR
jgi:crossover junction endodeoxyribonuclease RuvC